MALQTYGFHFSHYRNGSKTPIRRKYIFKDTETLTKGGVLNLESGEVDLFATGGDTGAIGVADETVSGTDSTTEIWVILDLGGQAVWRVTDANARTEGAELDITGTTGAQTVGADGDSDLIVEDTSSATEPTLVRFHPRAFGWLDA
jgi:hypothetical protein